MLTKGNRHFAFSGIRTAAFLLALCLFLFASTSDLFALPVYSTYRFKRNSERAIRRETRFIILHTTEGPAKGSGEKLKRNGEAHYMIDTAGRVYAVVDLTRVAYHCGLSMWNGRTNLDNCSIGIEMVGYHNRNLTYAQIKSLKSLIAELKRKYPGISDDRILTHSMVAYGSPNQWHRRNHRGRKRCGMKMAGLSLRAQLGIRSKPAYDPDVKARRLIVADKELFNILYRKGSAAEAKKAEDSYSKIEGNNVIGLRRSAWDIARDAYNASSTTYIFPNGTKKTGDKITEWKAMPRGTRVILGDAEDNPTPGKSSSSDTKSATKKTTSNKAVTSGAKTDQPLFSKNGNVIGPGRSAWDIAKNAYNAASTVYVLPDGTRKTGNEISDWKSLQKGTQVILASIDGNADSNGLFSAATVSLAGDKAKDLLNNLVGDAWNATNTYYITPDGKDFTGADLTPERVSDFKEGTKVLAGYRIAGPLTANTVLWNIAGPAWNSAETYYLFPNGTLKSGDKVNAGKLPLDTRIFLREKK